jgi:hypothetical protein
MVKILSEKTGRNVVLKGLDRKLRLEYKVALHGIYAQSCGANVLDATLSKSDDASSISDGGLVYRPGG